MIDEYGDMTRNKHLKNKVRTGYTYSYVSEVLPLQDLVPPSLYRTPNARSERTYDQLRTCQTHRGNQTRAVS